MQFIINILNDLIIIIGNLIIFTCMLNFKELKKSYKWTIAGFCMAFLVAYTLCVYVGHMAYIHATVICFTVPSIILFWAFSSIKDSRFFLTFCMVDTVSLIIAFVTKALGILYPVYAPYVTFVINLVIYALLIWKGRTFFNRYAQLLKFQNAGWNSMMVASFIIYFALAFTAAYPVPMIERTEYIPSYLVLSLVVLSCYVVFLDSIAKTKKLHTQYAELEKEKKYHKIAYTDALTGLYNRAYYIEKLNELERNRQDYSNICCVVIDINNLKMVNDRFGHHMGDVMIQDAASNITNIFSDLNAFVFRVGGDEFFIMVPDISKEDITRRLDRLNPEMERNNNLPSGILSVASGYSFLDIQTDSPQLTIEQNFVLADKFMYENKSRYKEQHPLILD